MLEHLQIASKWLTPSIYADIVEERNSMRKCGYPLCSNSLEPMTEKSKYRIAYQEKKVYEIQNSLRYCSTECNQKSNIYSQSLDESHPSSRKIAATLEDRNISSGNLFLCYRFV